MKFEFSRQIFEKVSNIKSHQSPSSGSRVVPCGQTDRPNRGPTPPPVQRVPEAHYLWVRLSGREPKYWCLEWMDVYLHSIRLHSVDGKHFTHASRYRLICTFCSIDLNLFLNFVLFFFALWVLVATTQSSLLCINVKYSNFYLFFGVWNGPPTPPPI
jgi:hypothetical protein